jgi:dienelactone hydrolase
VAPRSERDKDGKAPLKSDWYYGSPLFGADNPDLVFFDDLVKCLGSQFKTDSQRVYVTGMSGGGLMSTFLAIHRSSVIAAATPFSGGYLQPWPKASGKVPFVVSWGGPNDKAFQQNFDNMAKELIQGLRTDGHVVVACDHGKEHKWPAEGGAYAAKFLLAHTLDKPSPFASGLGDGWPAYCKLVQ